MKRCVMPLGIAAMFECVAYREAYEEVWGRFRGNKKHHH